MVDVSVPFTGESPAVVQVQQTQGRLVIGKLPCGSEVTVLIPREYEQFMMPGVCMSVHGFSVVWKEHGPHLDANLGSLKLFPACQRGDVQICEFYAGIAGWSSALRHFGKHTLVLVEKDHETAVACAARFRTRVMEVDEFLSRAFLRDVSMHTVVECDVCDDRLWIGLGLLNCGIGLSSPPCQPWSKAGCSSGLSAVQGESVKMFLERCAKQRWLVVLVEEVPGFRQHADFPGLISGLKELGLLLTVSGVYKVDSVTPLIRERWLATFVHSSVSVQNLARASGIDFSSPDFASAVHKPSMQDADILLPSSVGHAPLTIDHKAHALLTDPMLLPGVLRAKLGTSPSADDVINARILSHSQPLAGAMAAYGSQHEIPLELLQRNGLKTCLVRDPESLQVRYFSPWEIVAAMGHDATTVLSSNLTTAWRQAGNSLSPFHAFLQIVKTQMVLGDLPLMESVVPWADVLQMIRNEAIRMSMCTFHVNDELWFVQEREASTQPQLKKVRTTMVEGTVAPTVPFQVRTSDREVWATKVLPEAVSFDQPWSFSDATRGLSSFCAGGLVVVTHAQGHWMAPVHGPVQDTVERVITRALPHAEEGHFVGIYHAGQQVEWKQVIQCVPISKIIVDTRTCLVSCKCEVPLVVIQCEIDAMWKTKTMIAVLATKMHVHPDAISLWVGGLQVNDEDFLMQYETTVFIAKFKAAMPNYFSFDRLGNSDDNLRPAFTKGIRIFARHPAKRVLRTVAVEPGLTILDAVKRLLPDLTIVCPFQMYMVNAPLDHQTLVETLVQGQITEIAIEWATMRPLQVTKVTLSISKSEPGSLGFQQVHSCANACERWIRSPFKCKADAVRIPEDVSLAAVGNAYLAATQMPGSITVHAGSRLLDPVMTIGEVDVHEVISFRIAALPGGAKSGSNEAKQKIKKCLLSRGVPEAVVDDRMSQFLTKVPIEDFMPVPSDVDEMWDKMKEAANRAKFRLVQHFELKAHQKHGRASKPPSKPQKGKGNGKGNRDAKQIRAEDVVLDPKHFHDSEKPGVPVEVLPANRFGPDMAGLVVLSP